MLPNALYSGFKAPSRSKIDKIAICRQRQPQAMKLPTNDSVVCKGCNQENRFKDVGFKDLALAGFEKGLYGRRVS